MNFGFAPGRTGYDQNLRALFTLRANTTLVAPRGLTTVRQFVTHLATAPGIALPIDDALLGTHANSNGHIVTPLYAGQRGASSYDTIEETLDDPNRSIAISDDV